MLMSTAVAIQKEAFCCFCESNYKEAIREMKVRSQSPSLRVSLVCLPLSPFKSRLYSKRRHISWGEVEGETMKISVYYNNKRWMSAKRE